MPNGSNGGIIPAVSPILVEEELKNSFLDYAMSVVVSRAIPDIRDGLKPVHRRVLYTMHLLGFHYNRPYHKSVRVVGEVLGKFHPHGDQAVYNTMVGMVQEFSRRYPLLDGQGNWGSVDGDAAAAMRYTEVRMCKIAQEILADIEKETVHFVPNFDESTVEPTVLPSVLPNLLVNGTAGIAVGMATSIPPHNLGEVVGTCIELLKNPHLTDDELFELIPAPDFPTGGIICGRSNILKAYRTGRGSALLRAVVDIEETKKGASLIVTELPYQVNKAELSIKIADLVKNKVIEGISNIRDESDRRGMRLVIELKRGEVPSVTLNQLYKHTALQSSFSILMLGLLDNRPIVFTLRQLLEEFLHHRKQVVYKRSVYDLRKARAREHILAGMVIALQNIDAVVALIKASRSAEEATAELDKRYQLTAEQSKAILEMRLQRLTGLEQEKIHTEIGEVRERITYLSSIIEDEEVLRNEVIVELERVLHDYRDDRRSRIEGPIDILTEADLIPDEEVVVTLTLRGYVKRVPLDVYGVQHRGGRGKMGMATLEGTEDVVADLFVARNHDQLFFFTNFGRIYSLQAFEVPEASRIARGRAVVNLLPLQEGEKVVKLLCARDMDGRHVLMVSKRGIIKRTIAKDFAKIRSTGIRAVSLREGDELVFCALSAGEGRVVIATANGQGISFKEDEVRAMGRQATGVIGIRLRADDYVVGVAVVGEEDDIFFATERGYGKRVKVKDFRLAHRGGLGVRTIPTTTRNGKVIGLAIVRERSELLLIDEAGKIIRLSAAEVRTMGRQARGVRVIKLDPKQRLAMVVAFEGIKADDDDDSSGGGGSSSSSSSNQSPDVVATPEGAATSADPTMSVEAAREADDEDETTVATSPPVNAAQDMSSDMVDAVAETYNFDNQDSDGLDYF